MSLIVCSAKEAIKLLEHIDENETVILTIINKKNFIHSVPEKIEKKNGEELIKKAESIIYQDNDFFGTLSLYNVLIEKDIIHNILFPQLE